MSGDAQDAREREGADSRAALQDEVERLAAEVVAMREELDRREHQEATLRREIAAEETMRRRLVGLLEATPDVVGLASHDGHAIYLNEAGRNLLGLPRAGEIGQVHIPSFHDEASARLIIEQAIPAALERGSWHGETVLRNRLTGELTPVSQVVIAHRDAMRRVDYFSTLARPISEQRHLVETLRRSGESIRALVENLHVGVLVRGADGEVEVVNHEALAVLGLEEAEALGMAPLPSTFRIESLRGELVADERGIDSRVADTTLRIRDAVVRVHRPRSGDVRWVTISSTPEHDAEGRFVRSVTTFQDVTERHLLQAALDESRRIESMGRLAGGIAHDFNNLLTVIRGSIALAADELPRDSPIRGDLEASLEAAARASRLTKQILAFARKDVVRAATVDVARVVVTTAELLSRTLGTDVRIVTRGVDVPVYVRIDSGQFEQLVVNLALNARDAMPHGGTLEFTLRTDDPSPTPQHVFDGEPLGGATTTKGTSTTPGRDTSGAVDGLSSRRWVEFRVRDTGVGIPEDVQRMIFEPFFTTKPVGKGTGLGLATVHGIVRQHGGSITVQSGVDVGTTFSIFFPRALAPSVQEDGGSLARVSDPRENAVTILLVDDDPVVRGVTRRVLESRGHEVVEASDGQEALARLYGRAASAAVETPPTISLLVTDLVMPNMSGRALIRMVRQRDPKLPIIVVSGHPDEAERGAGGGLDERCLLKPYAPDELLAAVDAALASE